MPAERTATRKRSLVKALTYRVVIVCLDFLVVYLFTHKVSFMIVSNGRPAEPRWGAMALPL